MTERSLMAFKRIAIINRGEPAMRLIHAVRELKATEYPDLCTIAFYTEPDAASMYVRETDESFLLGPALFDDPQGGGKKGTFLNYARLKEALTQTRSEAAWVGWGFVAEHAAFADLCEELGVIFIGPSGEVMRRLGDKIASKKLAEQANVPVLPWSGGPVDDVDKAKKFAKKIGYPVMVKATAGGGGRGIRKVNAVEDLAEAFTRASAEAQKSFGDGTVFIEKAVSATRHVEVQVAGDKHGTVEFLYDNQTEQFHFMEMNTRLQVEHPVTEMTTGLDLVKLQLAVASGVKLEGEPPRTFGHAIEVRINAEDPDHDFAPGRRVASNFSFPRLVLVYASTPAWAKVTRFPRNLTP
jgi:acetyl/propionyl-CoA carboxylase alpha subunit